MPNEQKIDLLWDVPELEKQQRAVMSLIDEYNKNIEKVSTIQVKIDGSKGSLELSKNLKELAQSQDEIIKRNQLLISSTRVVNETLKQEALEQKNSTNVKLDDLKVQEKQLDVQRKQIDLDSKQQRQSAIASKKKTVETSNDDIPFTHNLAELEKERSEIEKTGTAVSELDKQQAAAAMSAAEYGNSVNKATQTKKEALGVDKDLADEKKKLTQAQSEENVELQGYRLQRMEANKAAKEEAMAALGMIGPYKQLEIQYRQQANLVKDLAAEYGENSEQAKAASAEALRMREQLEKIDAMAGDSFRRIGKYPTVFADATRILNAELDSVNKKIAAGASGKELDILTQKQAALTNAIGLTGKEFTTTAAQQKAFKDASKEIGIVYGTNSDMFKTFNKEVGKGNDAIKYLKKEVDGATGSSKGFLGALKGILPTLRNIANIIPGLGIGSLVLLLLTPLQLLGAAFVSLFDKVNYGKEVMRTYQEVNEKAVDGYYKQTSAVQQLTAVITDKTSSHKEQEEAYKRLIALNPEYLRGLTLENIQTEEGKKILDGYVESLRAKAELEAASNVNADKNKELVNLQNLKQELVDLRKKGSVAFDDLSSGLKEFVDNSTSAGRMKFTTDLFNLDIKSSDLDEMAKNIDKAITKAQTKVDASLEVYKDKFKKSLTNAPDAPLGLIAKIKKEMDELTKIQPTLMTEPEITANVKRLKELQDELDRLLGKTKVDHKAENKIKASLERAKEFMKKAQEEINKYNEEKIKAQQDASKAIMDNEEKSFSDRLNAAQDYYDYTLTLVEREKQGKFKVLDEEVKIALGKAKTEKEITAIKAYETAKQQSIVADANRSMEKAQIDFTNNVQKINKQARDKDEKEWKAYIERMKKAYEERMKIANSAVEVQQNNAAIKLMADYAIKMAHATADERLKLEKELQLKLSEIDKSAQLAKLQIQLKDLMLKKAILTLFHADTTNVEAEITKNLREQAEIRKGIRDGEYKDDEEKRNERLDRALKFEEEANKFVVAMYDRRYEKEKEGIQSAMDANEKKHQEELDAIDKLTISDQEKADKKAISDAIYQNKKEQLEYRQRQLDIQRAKFEKANSILQLIATTAVQVMKDGGPLSPKGLIDIAFGAFQLATILATPIPKFEHGLFEDYEGPGMVNDGWKREAIIRNDGSIELPKTRNKIEYFRKGDRVLPDADLLMSAIHQSSKTDMLLGFDGQHEGMEWSIMFEKLGDKLVRVEDAINNKPVGFVNITRDGFDWGIKTATSRTKILNSHINF